jgi:hypothetical protein
MFKFYLEGIEINDHPDGWDNINLTIKRDDLSGGLYFDADIRLTTYGGQDLFSALDAAWKANRYGMSRFDIFQRSGQAGYVLIHAGNIFHSDLKYELVNNSIEFKVDDNGWFSKIKNNQRIDATMGTTLSKNGINITPATSFTLSVHKVSNGTYYAQTRKAFKLYDCLRFLIDFMTDGGVTFVSDCFGVGGIYEYYCLVNGHELWSHDGTQFPRISFGKLFEELKKRLNVRFAMYFNGNKPTIRIEPADYFYETSSTFTLVDTPGKIEMSVDTSALYSGARVGSTKFETTSSLNLPDIQSLTSFREENVMFAGVNNVDAQLDLVGDLIVSNSIIEVLLEQLSGYDTYEEEVFLIEYTSANQTYNSNWIGTSANLYNESLNNYHTLQRWSAFIPGDVINTVTTTATGISKAVNTLYRNGTLVLAIGAIQGPVQFDDDYTLGYDPTLAYGGSTAQGTPVSQVLSIYTAAIAGNYSFTSQISLVTQVFGNTVPQVQVFFQKFNAANNVIDDFGGPLVNMSLSSLVGPTIISSGWNTYLNAGEYVAVYFKANAGSYGYDINPTDTYFICSGKDNGGQQLVITSNPERYKAIKVNMSYPLTLADYISIRDSKNGLISIPLQDNRTIRGWVETIKFDTISGETSITLTSDGNTVSR